MGLTIDTSVLVDFFIKKESKRHTIAKNFLKSIEGFGVFCPKLLLAELISVLSRYSTKISEVGYEFVEKNFNLIGEESIFEEVLNVCKVTSSRASDAYFIATAKLTNSILITNDKIMDENAKKYGVESYYLIEEYEKVEKRIKEMKQSKL